MIRVKIDKNMEEVAILVFIKKNYCGNGLALPFIEKILDGFVMPLIQKIFDSLVLSLI
jgi:hypothetical protein